MKRPVTRRPYDDLVRAVARLEQLPLAHVRRTIEQFVALVPGVVWALGRLSVPGLAVFRVRARKGRRVMNPHSRELMWLRRERAVAVRVAGSWRRRG